MPKVVEIMKKKYIHHKGSLLIGLLALNALCSCVNRRQELGMANGDGGQHIYEDRDGSRTQQVSRLGSIRDTMWSGFSYLSSICPGRLALLDLAVGFTAGYWLRSSYNSYNSKPENRQLHINLTTAEQEL